MALFASLQAIVGVHFRLGVIHLQDAMAAVAIVTLGRIRIAQSGNLAVIGVAVGREVFLVATSAILHDQKLGRILGRVGDVMRGMAVRAGCRLGIVLTHDFGAMHRLCIGLELLGMALLAANLRYRQVPLSALGGAARRYIEIVRIVTVVTSRVRKCFVVRARPGVIGLLVRLDILYHHSQSCFFRTARR